jgi:hypothetical protein
MPAFTITAVNTGADTLTAVGHAMLTGQRFRLRNIGGALPAATPALAPVTDYFAIRADADTFKIATSSGNASSGTAVDITGAGTGTQLLEYGLPYCVPRIAADLTQILPEDDNAAWQSIVALYDLLTGQLQSIWNGITLAGSLLVGGDVKTSGRFKHGTMTLRFPATTGRGQTQANSWSQGDGYIDGLPLPSWTIPIILPDGKRVTAARARVKDSTTGPTTIQFSMARAVDDGAPTAIGPPQTSAGTGAWQTLSITGLTEVISAAKVYYGFLVPASGSHLTRYAWLEVDYDEL